MEKRNSVNWWLTFTIKLIGDYVEIKVDLICLGKTGSKCVLSAVQLIPANGIDISVLEWPWRSFQIF